MPTEYYSDNPFYQLMVRILIRCGITDYLPKKTRLSKSDRDKLGQVQIEILRIQNLIKKANNAVTSRTQLRYILENDEKKEAIPSEAEKKDPVPSLVKLVTDYINKREDLKNIALAPQSLPEEVIEKLLADDTLQFLDRPSTSSKIYNVLMLADAMQIHYAVLDVLAACVTSNDESFRKIWSSAGQIFVRATSTYVPLIDSLLYFACAHGNETILKSFINDLKRLFTDEHPSPIKLQRFNQLFLFACEFGHLEIVKILLDSGANITYSDNANNTGFHLACKHGHYDLTKFMLEKNPNFVTTGNFSKDIGLNLAVKNGHLALVDLLLAHKSPVAGPASSDDFLNPESTTLDLTKKIKDPEVKNAMEKKLQQHRPDIYAKQSKLISSNRFNLLFLLIPAVLGIVLILPGIILGTDKPLFYFAFSLLAASFCCGLPIFCIRSYRYRIALQNLAQEENQLQENPQETTHLLIDNSLDTTYGSLQQPLAQEEQIIPITGKESSEGKKEETSDDEGNRQAKTESLKQSTERSRSTFFPETGVVIKDDSDSAQPPTQPLANPKDSEFGGIIHHSNSKNQSP